MAVDMFLKLTDVKGEAQDDKHKDEIDVLSWNFGATQPGGGHLGTGSGAGKVNMQDFHFVKYVDSASHTLFQNCCNGQHIKEGVLVVRKAGTDPVDSLKITLTDLIVSSYTTGGGGGEEKLTEQVSLHFATVKYEYTPQDKTGKGGAAKVAGWDVLANKKIG